MLIRTGMGGQLSGSVGGVVASHNKGGQYLRNRSIPVNPNSTRQQAARSAFAAYADLWKNLTAGQRSAWDSYASQTPITNRLGEQIHISGFNHYVRTNSFRAAAGAAPLSAAPTTPGLSSLGTITSITPTDGAGIVLVTVGATALGPAICRYGPPLSPGVSFFKGPFSLFGGAASLMATGGSFSQSSSVYGPLVEAAMIGVSIQGSDATGRLSDIVQQIVQVAGA